MTAVHRVLFETAGVEPPSELHVAHGCLDCHNRGFVGRTGVYERVKINEALRDLIVDGWRLPDVQAELKRVGFRSMFQNALTLVRDGLTSLSEVYRTVPEAQTPALEAMEPAPETAAQSATEPVEV